LLQRRWLRLLAVLIALTLVAAACGDDSDSDTSTGDDTDQTDTESSEVSLDDLCQEAQDAGVEAPDGFVVRLITDIGKVDDRTFNQFAFEGMEAAKECFGFETSFIETQSEADYAANIATSLEGDPDAIVTVGGLLATDTLAAAEANPEVSFIGVDQFQAEYPENYLGALFREDEGGYLAGVAAATLSESGVIGVVGGREDVPPVVRYVNAYETGAQSVNPDIEVLKIFNESFNDPAKGASDAQQFIGDGADVIFGAGGPTGSAGVKAATEQGLFGIGVDQDEYGSTFDDGAAPGSEFIATSAIKRVDISVFEGIVALLDGSFAGGIAAYDAANGGVTYAPSHDAEVPDGFLATLEETRQALAEGSIDIGVDPITGEPN
jgi:basic membrane lipoprotein Med (substrate-binding protein (PBP1-ABC) superfamily)